MFPSTNLRSRFFQLLVLLFCALGVISQVTADGVGYLYVKNYSESDLIIYIDGYEQKTLYKGYYDWFPTTQGHHRLETKKIDNPFKTTSQYVGCHPKGQVWISEHDFY